MARSTQKRYLNPGFPIQSPVLVALEEEAERLGMSINDVLLLWIRDHYEMREYLHQHGIKEAFGGWRAFSFPSSLPSTPLPKQAKAPAHTERFDVFQNLEENIAYMMSGSQEQEENSRQASQYWPE